MQIIIGMIGVVATLLLLYYVVILIRGDAQ